MGLRQARSCGCYLSSGAAALPMTSSQRLKRQFSSALLQARAANAPFGWRVHCTSN